MALLEGVSVTVTLHVAREQSVAVVLPQAAPVKIVSVVPVTFGSSWTMSI